MDYDNACTPHVVWKQGGEIYYKYKTGSSTWSTTFNLTDQSSYAPDFPVIRYIANGPHAAWQENINGNFEIIYRYKTVNWSNPVNISNNSVASLHPSIIGTGNGPMIIWAEKSMPANSIKYYLPDLNETDAIASFDWLYPNFPVAGTRIVRPGMYRIVVKWTEQFEIHEDAPPFKVDSRSLNKGIMPYLGKGHTAGAIPKELILFPNYPNPFNPNTHITFGLPIDSRVAVKIYDVLGREVITLTDQDYSAGYHSVYWKGLNHDGIQVSSGVYIYRMIVKDRSMCKKMLLIK